MIDLKKKLGRNELSLGSWITIGHTAVAEIMSRAGFDWLVVDMEHSAITLSEAQELIQVIGLSGVVPLVRVGENNPNIIKRVMDAGAHGVIVPMVNSREDAIKAVNAVKYPPIGRRGVGLARAQGYGLAFEEYKKWAAKKSVVIVQVEHIDAVDNLDDILSVKGVDGFLVGPYDLSGSLGIPGDFKNQKMKRALASIMKIAKKHDVAPGFHVVSPSVEELRGKAREGYRFIGYCFDALFLGSICADELAKAKKAFER